LREALAVQIGAQDGDDGATSQEGDFLIWERRQLSNYGLVDLIHKDRSSPNVKARSLT